MLCLKADVLEALAFSMYAHPTPHTPHPYISEVELACSSGHDVHGSLSGASDLVRLVKRPA